MVSKSDNDKYGFGRKRSMLSAKRAIMRSAFSLIPVLPGILQMKFLRGAMVKVNKVDDKTYHRFLFL